MAANGVDRRGRGIAATRLDHVPHQLARRCLRRRHSGVADLVVEPRPRRLVSANTTERGRTAFRATRSKSDAHVNGWAPINERVSAEELVEDVRAKPRF